MLNKSDISEQFPRTIVLAYFEVTNVNCIVRLILFCKDLQRKKSSTLFSCLRNWLFRYFRQLTELWQDRGNWNIINWDTFFSYSDLITICFITLDETWKLIFFLVCIFKDRKTQLWGMNRIKTQRYKNKWQMANSRKKSSYQQARFFLVKS